MNYRIFILLVMVFPAAHNAFGQVSAATSTYLRTQSAGVSEAIIENGRFVVKKPAPQTKNQSVERAPENISLQRTEASSAPAPAAVSDVAPAQTSVPKAVLAPTSKSVEAAATDDAPLWTSDAEAIDAYLAKLDADDRRLNLLELSFAPTFFYVNSSSDYWYRDYSSSGPGIDVGADIWLSPFVGISANYFTTLAADLTAEPAQSGNLLVDHRISSAAIQFRSFSSTLKSARTFVLGLGFSEYEMVVPKSADERIGIESTGPLVMISSRLPTSASSAWTIQMSLLPKLKVDETATSVSVESGTGNSSYGLIFEVGRDWDYDRHTSVFCRVGHRYEKTIYEGAASVADPRSGTTPTGLSVTSGLTFFQFGFTWGD